MIRAQLDIFGGSKRIDPWVDICIQKLKRYCPTPPFSKTEMHKIIAGEIYAEIPKMDQVVRGILKTGNVEDGRKLIAAAFRHNDFPAPDTIARALRTADETLRTNGTLIWGENKDTRADLDQLLVEIEQESPNIDSSLEARFYLSLMDRFNENYTFLRPGQIDNFTVDFLCRAVGLSIEIDGFEYHQDRQSFTWDRRKARIMQRKGFTHLQFSGAELSTNGGIQTALNEIAETIQRRLNRRENGK